MSVFKIVYDPATGSIEENPIRVVGEPLTLNKIIVYTKADSPTPAINAVMALIGRDKSKQLGILEMIMNLMSDLEVQHKEARRLFNSIFCDKLRESDGSPFSYKKMPYLQILQFFGDMDFMVNNSILGRLQWLKEEIEK